MKWKGEYKKTFQSNYGLCIKYKNQQIIEKRKIFKKKQKNKQRNKNGEFPGSGSLSWLGPHSRSNALPTELRGTYHDLEVNIKIIYNKKNACCKEQVQQDSEEIVFWL